MITRPDCCSWCPDEAVDLCPAEIQHSQADVRAVPAVGLLFSFLPTSGCHTRAFIVFISVSGSSFHTVILLPPLFHVDFCSSVYWRNILCQPFFYNSTPSNTVLSPHAPLLSNKSFSYKFLTLCYIFILLLPHIPYKGLQLTGTHTQRSQCANLGNRPVSFLHAFIPVSQNTVSFILSLVRL